METILIILGILALLACILFCVCFCYTTHLSIPHNEWVMLEKRKRQKRYPRRDQSS